MHNESSISFLKEWYETLRSGDHHTPAADEIAGLHLALSMRSRELERIQAAVEDGTEVLPPLWQPHSATSTTHTFEAIDESTFHQLMVAQARRAAPWLDELRAYMKNDRDSNRGEYESARELIERMVQDTEAKSLAFQVADELRALNIKVVGRRWWTYGMFQDGCTAFRLACRCEPPPDNWITYTLIDLSDSAGTIPPGLEELAVVTELIGFLIGLYERRHFHLSYTSNG